MVKIILPGNPLSTNHAYRRSVNGRMYMPEDIQNRKREYWWETKRQYKGKPITGPITIEVDLYFSDNRKRDWDNYHKLSMDALNGLVWRDDSQVQEALVTKNIDKENPRIEIIIHDNSIA